MLSLSPRPTLTQSFLGNKVRALSAGCNFNSTRVWRHCGHQIRDWWWWWLLFFLTPKIAAGRIVLSCRNFVCWIYKIEDSFWGIIVSIVWCPHPMGKKCAANEQRIEIKMNKKKKRKIFWSVFKHSRQSVEKKKRDALLYIHLHQGPTSNNNGGMYQNYYIRVHRFLSYIWTGVVWSWL